MSNFELIVFTYNSEDEATQALTQIVSAKQQNTHVPLVLVNDAAVGRRDNKGNVTIHQTLESAVKGTRVMGGGLWGLLIGLLVGSPLVGTLMGIGVRVLGNTRIDLGIDNAFITKVSNSLAPGQSALFILTTTAEMHDLSAALGDHNGTLQHTSLSDQASKALNESRPEPTKKMTSNRGTVSMRLVDEADHPRHAVARLTGKYGLAVADAYVTQDARSASRDAADQAQLAKTQALANNDAAYRTCDKYGHLIDTGRHAGLLDQIPAQPAPA